MSDHDALVVPTVEAASQPAGRLAFAAGRRFFLLLAIGVVWLVPAFVDLRLAYAVVAWDVLLAIAWIVDAATLPHPSSLVVSRAWGAPLALSVESRVQIDLANNSGTTLFARVTDDVPPQLRREPAHQDVVLRAHASSSVGYLVRPLERGDIAVGDVWVRYQGPFRIAERWARAPLSLMSPAVRVYPNLDEARRHAIVLVRSRQSAVERRRARVRGAGREFESLREYREGDEFRDICWTASARRGKLVARTFQVERSQTIWIVVDSGRLMRTRVGELSKLDYAANAALSLAQVALHTGDRVGLLTYGRQVRHRVPAARGSAHLKVILDRLAAMREEPSESDHLMAAGRLLADQKRRCLVVWLTDLPETAMTPEVVEAAQAMPRHLVLLVAIGQPDLARLAARQPDSVSDMYRAAASHELLHRREALIARMRDRGVLALEASSATLSPALVNAYLAIKERGRL